MDYEKKYKEAVCNIQKLLENGRKEGEVICAYEADFMSIFPELKESEDERIRKGLIEYFKDFRLGTFAYLEPKKIIDWLEKQGTPAKLSEEEQNRFVKCVLSSCALSFIDYLDAHKYEGKMCVSNGECEDIENAFHNAMWDRLHRYYCKYIENQKPAEWSEEDEKQARQIERIVRDGGCTQKLQKQIADWLKSLKDRVGCEMNCTTTKEWSEEDESKIRHLIAFLDTNPNSVIYSRPKEEWINWLKSLRPRSQWKPSEEQIYELTKAVDYYTSHGFPNKILDELLKQLYNLL